MFLSRLLFFGSVVLAATPACAGDLTFQRDSGPVSLIELYSSEGCSSCPPAEEWLGQWKDSPQLWQQVFPVAFHVDYWDGLGWPDRFAKSAYTERQRNYAAKLGQDSVYTPEFVVNGREWRGWFHGGTNPETRETEGRLVLKIDPQGRTFSADYQPAAPAAGNSYTLHVGLLGMGIASDVQSGENAGRKLRHDFVVLAFRSQSLAADPSGHFRSEPVTVDAGSDAPHAVVAWVSTPDAEVVQVVGGSLP
jgi:hypothetical protein